MNAFGIAYIVVIAGIILLTYTELVMAGTQYCSMQGNTQVCNTYHENGGMESTYQNYSNDGNSSTTNKLVDTNDAQ
jgi:hypothetical protein